MTTPPRSVGGAEGIPEHRAHRIIVAVCPGVGDAWAEEHWCATAGPAQDQVAGPCTGWVLGDMFTTPVRSIAILALSLGVAGCAAPGGASQTALGSFATPLGSPSTTPAPASPGQSSAPATANPDEPLTVEPVLLYFSHGATSDVCVAEHPVIRWVGTRTPEVALQALLAGPTDDERAAGYSSWFSHATAGVLIKLDISGVVARADFRDLDHVIPNASSSCGSGALLSALDATLRQFPAIHETRYSINGSEERFYFWLQRSPP